MLLSTNGRKIHFDIVGPEAAPVVFFAHALAADAGMWSEQVPTFLSAGYRVLRADLRGHGGSEIAPGNYTMTQLVGDVVYSDSPRIRRFLLPSGVIRILPNG